MPASRRENGYNLRRFKEQVDVLLKNPAQRVAFEMRGLVKAGLCTPMGGNFSFKDPNDPTSIIVTPGHIDKRLLVAADMVQVNLETGKYDGGVRKRQPTSEVALHRRIFNELPDVNAIAHAHPRNAVFLSLLTDNQAQKLIDEAVAYVPEYAVNWLGPNGVKIMVTDEYEMMWSDELAEQVTRLFKDRGASVVIMRNHGPIAIGKTASEVAEQIRLVEELAAHALMVAQFRGQHLQVASIPKELSVNLVQAGETYQQIVNEGNS